VSQPLLTTTLALAIAIALTAATAIVTSATETPGRAIKLTVLIVIVAFAVVALQRADLRINFTGSMPIGIYRLSPLRHKGVKRGMLVALCPPARAAKIGRERGYLAMGPCADSAELLLKFIAAVAGDTVDVTTAGVTVNGCLLAKSQPVLRDRSGHRLVPWPHDHFRLRPGVVWLYADNDRSWDSRYWGTASVAHIVAIARPLTSPWPDLRCALPVRHHPGARPTAR
jgi:conjugative transfer signal peptidase TraF